MIKIPAYAKINLFLEVTARRPDGYHDLVTLFARVGVADRLYFRKSDTPGIKLSVIGGPRELGYKADNIVYKAAVEFFKLFNLEPAVEIKLEKLIPVGAGLGGGSSDAAAALLGLAKLYKLPRKKNMGRLRKLAASLGSDVPFFMLNAMAAEGRGRGEKLKALEFKGRLPYVVLVYPGAPVYTKEVYGNLKVGAKADIKERLSAFAKLRGLLERGSFSPEHAELLFNRSVPALCNARLESPCERTSEANLTASLSREAGIGRRLERDRRVRRERIYAIGAKRGRLPRIMEVLVARKCFSTVNVTLPAIPVLDSVGRTDRRIRRRVGSKCRTEWRDVGCVIVGGVGYRPGKHAECCVKCGVGQAARLEREANTRLKVVVIARPQ